MTRSEIAASGEVRWFPVDGFAHAFVLGAKISLCERVGRPDHIPKPRRHRPPVCDWCMRELRRRQGLIG